MGHLRDEVGATDQPCVLVADDDESLREVLVELLESRDYRVVQAVDGRDCLTAIARELPDVLVLDISMPELDGFGVLQEMEVLQLDAQPPDVIVLTGHGGVRDGVRAVRAGAIGFLTKPARSVELLTLIERAVAGRQALSEAKSVLVDARKRWECAMAARRANMRSITNHLAAEIRAFGQLDPTVTKRILMATDEALTNAVVHGCLEVGSSLKEDRSAGAFADACAAREADDAYADRRVGIVLEMDATTLTVSVQDDGPGFDTAALPDPDDPEVLLLASGRGILIMRSLMHDVRFEDSGRRVVMVHRMNGNAGDP
jgi:FixJ family two-component response regulator/anti-sigma regulatory factor (Ser/Thr protein kinase)